MSEEQVANPPIGKMIDKQTVLIGYIAEMATSSKIPKAFGNFFEANGDNGSMVGLNIREDDLLFTLNGLKTSQLRGALIGAEYGKAAMSAMDRVTKEAEIAGYVDACVIQEGRLIGHIASSAALTTLMPVKEHKRVAIWGAGAFATSLILNLDEKGFDEVVICVDRVESAMELIEKVSPFISQLRFDIERVNKESVADFRGYDYVVNTTPVGVFAHDKALEVEIDTDVTMVDTVYNKQNTQSLFESFATIKGANYISGFDMITAAAPIHYSVWYEKQANETMKITRG
jgi:shikimate dehydrogenase